MALSQAKIISMDLQADIAMTFFKLVSRYFINIIYLVNYLYFFFLIAFQKVKMHRITRMVVPLTLEGNSVQMILTRNQ